MLTSDQLIDFLKEKIKPNNSPIALEQILKEIIMEKNGFDEKQAGIETAKLKIEVANKLDDLLMNNRKSGNYPWFNFYQGKSYVRGPFHTDFTDEEVEREEKAKLATYFEQMKNILKEITFKEFEEVCGAILSLLGAKDYKRTPHSNDQGIDFFGTIPLSDLSNSEYPFVQFQHNFILWVIGQAKHYPGRLVGTEELRSLVGSISLARFGEYATEGMVSNNVKLRSLDPILALFMTTGDYSAPSKYLAQKSGIILKNIDDISYLLIRNDIGIGFLSGVNKESLVHWAKETLKKI
ncbi:restriction endonuclease [Bacillus sp. S56]|uniref:restriction endonuclease n=1 Tax=Bacillus sp. S56 TaxID=1226987 RepID=UPI00190B38AA|nr:restriction endonuclease [Bacillus sp. S56]MBK0072369.1 restriction endonuclease [Bacillus sp. S56]